MTKMFEKENFNTWDWGDFPHHGTSLRQLERKMEKIAEAHDDLFVKGCVHGAKLVTEVLKKGIFELMGGCQGTAITVSYDTDMFGFYGKLDLLQYVDQWEPRHRLQYAKFLRNVADKVEKIKNDVQDDVEADE